MTLRRRQFLTLAASAAAMPALSRVASAQAYPSRPVTMIVPFPAAGPADVLARILSEPMRQALGQPIVIENVSGAAGSIAVGRVARAAPDGYTLILGNLGTHVVNGAIYALQYDLVKDFEPVCAAADQLPIAHRQKRRAGEGFRGTHRLAEGECDQGHDRDRRSRRPIASDRRVFPERTRRAVSADSVSRHPAGAGGSDRGADRSGVRPGVELDSAGARRQDQDLRSHRADPAALGPRHSDAA